MSKLMTAKSYANAERINEYEKNGKMYAKVKIPCDRCVNGVYVIGVENGQYKAHPAYGGVCLKCGGVGYEIKEVRLYTEAELQRMEDLNEKNRIKREQEKEARWEKEFAETKKEWLAHNGFSEDGYTYIVTGNSFSIKDELKAAGWRYDPVLKWHKADPAGYEDRVVKFHVDQLFEFSAWGKGHYISGCKEIVDKALAATQPEVHSEWIGEVGEKIKGIKVQLVKKYTTETRYGLNTLYSFQTKEGNILNWWTTTFQAVEINDWVTIKYATIKKLDTHKDVKNTIITRAKLINTREEKDRFEQEKLEWECINPNN